MIRSCGGPKRERFVQRFAEIASLIETVELRGLRRHLTIADEMISTMIANGDGKALIGFPQFPANNNYFSVFDQLIARIGLLSSREAFGVMRFYTAARSATEMVIKRPGVDCMPMPAEQMILHVRTEAHMMDIALELGRALLEKRDPVPPDRPDPSSVPDVAIASREPACATI